MVTKISCHSKVTSNVLTTKELSNPKTFKKYKITKKLRNNWTNLALLAQQSPSFTSKIKKFNMEFGKELDQYIHFAKQYCVRQYWSRLSTSYRNRKFSNKRFTKINSCQSLATVGLMPCKLPKYNAVKLHSPWMKHKKNLHSSGK